MVPGFSGIGGDTSHSSHLTRGIHLYPLWIFLSFVSHTANQSGRIDQLICPCSSEGNQILPQSGRASTLGSWQDLPYLSFRYGRWNGGFICWWGPCRTSLTSASDVEDEAVGWSTGKFPIGLGWVSSSNSALDVEDEVVRSSTGKLPIGLGWVSSYTALACVCSLQKARFAGCQGIGLLCPVLKHLCIGQGHLIGFQWDVLVG